MTSFTTNTFAVYLYLILALLGKNILLLSPFTSFRVIVEGWLADHSVKTLKEQQSIQTKPYSEFWTVGHEADIA